MSQYLSVIQIGRNLANGWKKNTTWVLKKNCMTFFPLKEFKNKNKSERVNFHIFLKEQFLFFILLMKLSISLLHYCDYLPHWFYHLSYASMIPLHVGTLLLHAPSRQVILTVPVNLKLAWQANETFLPCRKSKPILRPFCGLPGSVQDSENFK